MHAQFSTDENHIDSRDESSGSNSAKQLRERIASPDYGPKPDIGKRVFCNRPLNMKNIVAVGFDMDYTLAQYMPETFESLAYQHTVEKLVYDLKYPSEVCLVCLVLNLTMFNFFILLFLVPMMIENALYFFVFSLIFYSLCIHQLLLEVFFNYYNNQSIFHYLGLATLIKP